MTVLSGRHLAKTTQGSIKAAGFVVEVLGSHPWQRLKDWGLRVPSSQVHDRGTVRDVSKAACIPGSQSIL